jgi:hypothetical protein
MEFIKEIGGADFFDPAMSENIRSVIGTNAMTPSVARDFVQKLAKERAVFMDVVTSTKDGITQLGVQGNPEEQVPAEMAFLIPRDLFENHLGDFAKELQFINRFVLDFSEAVSGHPEPVDVQRLSSSMPTISLAADLGVMLLIGKIVEKFLDAWKKVEEIREIRERLRKLGMDSEATATELKNKINKTISDVVDETVNETIERSPVESGRKNELRIALRNDTLKLYSQIERGLNVEVRVSTKATPDAEDGDGRAKLEQLRSLSVKLQFPQVAGEPILLPPPGDDEDGNGAALKGEVKKRRKSKGPQDGNAPVEG